MTHSHSHKSYAAVLRHKESYHHRKEPYGKETAKEAWKPASLLALAPDMPSAVVSSQQNVIFTWPDVAASCLVLVSRPGSHWQTPIGVLQNVRNAACMCQVQIHCAIAQKVRGKGKHGADAVA